MEVKVIPKVYLSPSTQERNVGGGGRGNADESSSRSLAQVEADSNSKKPDLYFAIHSNAGGGVTAFQRL